MRSTSDHVFVVANFLTEGEAETIYNEVIRIEPELMKLGPDNFSNTEGDTLTGRFCYYNALDNDLVGRILIPKLISLFGLGRWYQAWFNTFREGECIKSHVHNDRSHPNGPEYFTCCNLFLGGDQSDGTYYNGVQYPNTQGGLLIFRDDIPHWTTPYTGKDVRISMACDIHPTQQNRYMKRLA